jgi:hypothetical protein
MAWQVSGQSMELCSCKLMCPCWLGPQGEPDQGWCAGALAFDVRQGNANGVDLSGCKAVVVTEFPGNFFEGNGTARVYIDEGAGEDQRRELEAILSGQSGGHLEALMGAVISRWLPAKTAKIELQWGDNTTVTLGDFGRFNLERIKDGAGTPTMIQAAAAQTGFQLENMGVASYQR